MDENSSHLRLAIPATLLLTGIVFIGLFITFLYKDIGKNAQLQAYGGEPKIYYRLTRSETYGMFSDAGLLGFCDGRLRGTEREKYSVYTYLDGNCPNYSPYESQSGLQGLVYSFIDIFYKNAVIFRILCALFLSAVLAAWFVWLRNYFGIISSLIIMAAIPFFQSLVFFGDNIAHVLGATYLIMVALFWAYEKKSKYLGAITFSVVLLKLLLNGPEYIFAALLLPFLPLVFYSVLRKTPLRQIVREIFLITKGILLACLTALLILFLQVSSISSPADAVRYFADKAMARTFFPQLLPANEAYATAGITRLHLLYEYLSFPAISLGSFQISFGMLVLFFGVTSIIAVYLYRRYGQRTLLALFATTWASILCPLAWILIAKGHSATELYDRLVWHMPFTLFGTALFVVTLQTWITNHRSL